MEKKLHPNISVDCVIFGFDFNTLNVILVERKLIDPNSSEELISDYTLAGNHVYEDEDLEDAARRVLFDLTGLENIYLEQFYISGSPERLKKEKDQLWLKTTGKSLDDRVVSTCYFSLLNCNEVKIKQKGRNVGWFPVGSNVNLGFDHKEIIDQAIISLQRKLQFEPIGFEMLPAKFTLSQLQKLYEVVFGIEFDKRNFRKKVSKMKYLVQLDEKQKGVSHKPARFYSFDENLYQQSKTNILNFTV